MFKMTFTQLFLNAVRKFLNIIVLWGGGAHGNHDIRTEENHHPVMPADKF